MLTRGIVNRRCARGQDGFMLVMGIIIVTLLASLLIALAALAKTAPQIATAHTASIRAGALDESDRERARPAPEDSTLIEED